MLFFCLWGFSLILCLLSFCFNKFNRTSGLIALLIYGIIEGNPNYFYGDASVYFNDYMFKTQQFEKGYNFLTGLFGTRFDYLNFRLITSILFLLLLYFAVVTITNRVSLFSMLYGIGAFPNDVQQVRNQMASVFIVFGIVFLYKYGKKGIIPAFFTIYLGSLFHSIALIFLLVPILFYFDNLIKLFNKISVVGLITAIIAKLATSIPNLNTLVSGALSIFSSRETASTNVTDIYSNNVIPISIWTLTIIVTLIMFYLITSVYEIRYTGLVRSSNIFSLEKVVVISFYIWIIGLVLLASSIEYIRILRISSVLLFIVIAKLTEQNKDKPILLPNRIVVISLLYSIILLILQAWIYYVNLDNWFKALNFI